MSSPTNLLSSRQHFIHLIPIFLYLLTIIIIIIYSHPIDVVKTRLQVSGDGTGGTRNYKALGIGGTVNVIYTEEGVAAFWKGIMIMMIIMIMLMMMIIMTCR